MRLKKQLPNVMMNSSEHIDSRKCRIQLLLYMFYSGGVLVWKFRFSIVI